MDSSPVGGFNPSEKKNISQIGSSPQVRVKIKNVWNHNLVLDKNFQAFWESTPKVPINQPREFMRIPGVSDLNVILLLLSLPKTNSSPLGRAPKGNNRLPRLHLQVLTASFREGSSKNFPTWPWNILKRPPTNSLWRNSFHLGYAKQGVCWGSLRIVVWECILMGV